jgi:hypothetical protein
MLYAALIYSPADAPAFTEEQFGQVLAEYDAYTEALKEAGIWRAGEPLQLT